VTVPTGDALSRFDTMPSRPMRHACRKIVAFVIKGDLTSLPCNGVSLTSLISLTDVSVGQ
jgi:hypothetical protein